MSQYTVYNSPSHRRLNQQMVATFFAVDDDGDISIRSSVHRHIIKCLKFEIRLFARTRQFQNALDVLRQFENLAAEVDEVYQSARSVLEVDGELNFDPRAWEVMIVYEDLKDTNKDGSLKQKRDRLSVLLERLEVAGVRPISSLVTSKDPRLVLREVMDQILKVSDRLAKFYGWSEKERKLDEALHGLREAIRSTAKRLGTDYQTELVRFLEIYSHRIRPDLLEAIRSDLL